jgi:hypothetical protein
MVESTVAQSTFVPLLSAKPATGPWLEVGERMASKFPICEIRRLQSQLL